MGERVLGLKRRVAVVLLRQEWRQSGVDLVAVLRFLSVVPVEVDLFEVEGLVPEGVDRTGSAEAAELDKGWALHFSEVAWLRVREFVDCLVQGRIYSMAPRKTSTAEADMAMRRVGQELALAVVAEWIQLAVEAAAVRTHSRPTRRVFLEEVPLVET